MVNLRNPKYGKGIFSAFAIFWGVSGAIMYVLGFQNIPNYLIYEVLGLGYLAYGYFNLFMKGNNNE